MTNQEMMSYGLIVFGSILTLVGGYQLLKRGFLFWMILIIVGVSGINYGLNNRNADMVDGFLKGLNPANLSDFSKEQLREICKGVGIIAEQ